jgi:6-phosphogluconolactonase
VASVESVASRVNGSLAVSHNCGRLMTNRRDALRLLVGLGTTAFTGGPWSNSKGVSYSKEGNVVSPPAILKNFFVYVGCRTTKERNARGKGISVCTMDTASGEWSQIQLFEGLINPSFLAFDRAQRFLYCVHGDFDEVSAFSIDSNSGKLSFVNRQNTGGTNPVHLSVDPSGRFVVIANYGTGSVVSLPILVNGSLGPLRHRIELPGSPGPHRLEQTSSHPHQIAFSPDGKFIVVPDKGLDRIFMIALNELEGTLEISNAGTVNTRSAAGPRHAGFHPTLSYMYVINELDSTVTTYRFDGRVGKPQPLERISTLPPTFTGNNAAAGIAVHPSGRYLYCSNRGHDSIARFAISADGASLSAVDWEPSQGKQPRFFALDPSGSFLYAANEMSDTIIPFHIETQDGRLRPLGQVIETGSPVCVVFKDKD